LVLILDFNLIIDSLRCENLQVSEQVSKFYGFISMSEKKKRKERKQLGFNIWAEATRQVQDRSKWRGLVHGPILHEETGN
jgi:hypothetical protein